MDDEPSDRALAVREVLGAYPGAEVVEAGSREELEAALADPRPFDLVVTDLALKWGSGREVLARVRRGGEGGGAATPVVMFTDSGDETTAVELMKAGLDDYVVKSARQLPRLRASVRLAVEGGRNRTALTERERQLALALDHERTLVRELHHRVKNNLQTVTALLEARARTAAPEAAAPLRDAAERMRALGAVQARLYETDRLDEVDIAGAVADIAERVVAIQGEGRVRLALETDGPVPLDAQRAMPVGLLCYEAVLNALKHAWPDGRAGGGGGGGTLLCRVERGPPARVRIEDDGVGYGPSAKEGLGSWLLRALAREAGVQVAVGPREGGGTSVTLALA